MRTFHRRRKTRKREPLFEMILSGESTPEDPDEFYVTFCESLEAFCKPKSFKTVSFVFNFKLEYYNSTSAHHLVTILTILKPLVKRKLVIIKWFYAHDDEDMQLMGEDLTETMHIKMEMVRV